MIQYNKYPFILIFIFISLKINAQKINVIDNKGTIATVNNNNITSSNTAPTNPLEGDVWFDTLNSEIKIYDTEPLFAPVWRSMSGYYTDNIYNINGTLTSGRNVNGGNYDINFNNFKNYYIYANNFIRIQSSGYLDLIGASGINLYSDTRITGNLSVEGGYRDSGNSYGTTGQILSSTGVTTTAWIDPNLVTVINKTSNYTLALADNGKVFTFNSATDITLTVPNGLPIGYNISLYQIGIGKITIQGGATILNRLSRFKTAGKDAGAGLIATGTDTFHLTGDLKK